MAAKKLNAEQKRFIVMELAMFSTPAEVVEKVFEEHGVTITRQGVQVYDPTSAAGHSLSKELRKLFDDTRKAFRKDTENIPIANRAYRLRQLDRLARGTKNPVLAAQLMEQAAKETGGSYTNRREFTGKGGGPIQYTELSDEQLDREIARLGGAGEGEDAPPG